MAIKYHFYKCGRQPEEPHRYYDHSSGVAGFLAPQDRGNYLGFMTIEEVETEIPYQDPNSVKSAIYSAKRYTNVTRQFNSRF